MVTTVGWGPVGGRMLAGMLLVFLLVGCSQGADGAANAQGRALYEAHCAACHGLRGEGQPGWQQANPDGSFPAPPHDGSGHTWHHADAQLLQIIAEGGQMPGSQMPAFGDRLSQPEMEAILAHIKGFWTPEQRASQADITHRWNGGQ